MEERHVVTCFLEHGGKILLLRRSEKVGTYKGRWAGVSGYLEEGHTPLEQAMQEIEEETGLGAEDVELAKEGQPLEVVDEGLGWRWVVHPFRFSVTTPEKIGIDWEHTELKWIAPDDMSEYETVPKLREVWKRVA